MGVKYSTRAIEQVDPQDAAELAALGMGDSYGREKSATLWEWKHRLNPAGRSLGLAAYSTTGTLIALRPFMRWDLVDRDGRNIIAVRAVDSVVHPQFQRQGVFSRLTNEALESLCAHNIQFVFNTPNCRSKYAYQKLGWRMLGHPIVWVQLRPMRMLMRPVGNRGNSGPIICDDCDAGESLAYAHTEHDRCERRVISVNKTPEYWSWRYQDHPNVQYRFMHTDMRDNCGRGVAVVRHDSRRGIEGIAIVDQFSESAEVGRAAFYGILDQCYHKLPGDYTVVMGPPSNWGMLKRRFVPIRWRNVTFAVKPLMMDANDPVLLSRRAWQLSLGDLEFF